VISAAVVALGATNASAQYPVGGGFDYLPTFSPSATPYESFLRGEAEFMRAQAWSARMAAEARSKAIAAETEAMRLNQLKIAEKKAFFAEKQAKLDAYMTRVRESQAAAAATVRPVTFRAIDVERRVTLWPEVLQAERYTAQRTTIERIVERRLTRDEIPSGYEVLAAIEPLRNRVDSEYQQGTLRFDHWVAAKHALDDVQKELRQPLPSVRLASTASN
jgi:hypothetical protein